MTLLFFCGVCRWSFCNAIINYCYSWIAFLFSHKTTNAFWVTLRKVHNTGVTATEKVENITNMTKSCYTIAKLGYNSY